jgi:DNA/RNA-binding domain of Phe-tRNA-synthetase-like protein
MHLSIRLGADVADRFPQADIRLLVASGMDNAVPWPQVDAAVAELNIAPPDENEPAIASWFATYRSFGTNPRRMRPSVYALLRRIEKSGTLPRISPAVDAYNLASVTHRVCAGAFDLAALPGPVEIRFTRPGDEFVPLGEPDTVEQPHDGEVVYASGSTVLTRHWNHRDSDLTKVTEATTDAVFVLETVDATMTGALGAAANQLAALLESSGAHVQRGSVRD